MTKYGVDAVPAKNDKLDEWRENFKGVQFLHEPTNLIITGAIDDLWEKMLNVEDNIKMAKAIYDYNGWSGWLAAPKEWQ